MMDLVAIMILAKPFNNVLCLPFTEVNENVAAVLNTGMLDRSRMVLCVFMLGVLAFNPFSSIFGKIGGEQAFDYSQAHDGSRMLHSTWNSMGKTNGFFF